MHGRQGGRDESMSTMFLNWANADTRQGWMLSWFVCFPCCRCARPNFFLRFFFHFPLSPTTKNEKLSSNFLLNSNSKQIDMKIKFSKCWESLVLKQYIFFRSYTSFRPFKSCKLSSEDISILFLVSFLSALAYRLVLALQSTLLLPVIHEWSRGFYVWKCLCFHNNNHTFSRDFLRHQIFHAQYSIPTHTPVIHTVSFSASVCYT